MFSWSKGKVEGLIEESSGLPFFLPSPGRDLRLLCQSGSRREARPVERVDSALRALDARDSRHWAGRTAVQAALRSLITSPGRPPAFRRAHGNATLWYNVHVSAASIPDAQSPMARDNILGHPSLPDSAQRTRQRRVAGALYQIPARLCASARGGGRAAALPT